MSPEETLKALSAVGYMEGYESAPETTNITVHDRQLAYDGVNLVLSAHAPSAFLMDMDGNVLHRWNKPFAGIFTGAFEDMKNPPPKTQRNWRRVHLLENGDLLAIFMNFGLIKIDKDSNLLWSYKGACHHDLFVDDTGEIYVLTRRLWERDPLPLESWEAKAPVLEDFVTVLSPEGEKLKSVSVVEAFLNSSYAPHLEHLKSQVDVLHTNTIRPIDGRLADEYPMFQEGHLLLSMRQIHTLAILDLENEKLTWALTGQWSFQHEPRILEDGRMLLLDNRGYKGKSQVIEFDPLTQEIVWSYRGQPPEAFYTKEVGTLQRLPNGNTLIIESAKGRAFEVTRDGTIVWEFFNPHRVGREHELIATLFDVVRLEDEEVSWLQSKTD